MDTRNIGSTAPELNVELNKKEEKKIIYKHDTEISKRTEVVLYFFLWFIWQVKCIFRAYIRKYFYRFISYPSIDVFPNSAIGNPGYLQFLDFRILLTDYWRNVKN